MRVVPLIQFEGHPENGNPLRDEIDLKPQALLETPEQAMAEPARRNQLRKVLQEADDAFPGLLMDNWGLTWVSIDYLDDREVDVLKMAGKYEILKNQLELRRRKVE